MASTTVSPTNPNIQYVGRIDFSTPDKPLFAFPNVTIKAKFEGTSIDLLLKNYTSTTSGNNYFVSIVDKGTPTKFAVNTTTQTYSIAKNLTDGVHTVEIIKVTESYYGGCQFLGFQLDDGKTLLAPDPLANLKIEFYGNSITCGFGNDGSTQPAADNSYKAYAAVAARDLNAQIQTISYSGIGVAQGATGTEKMGVVYNKIIATPSSTSSTATPIPSINSWDFTKYVPNVVVVALGTNDWTWLSGLSSGTASVVTTFKTAYNNLLTQIRTSYPNAKIVCTNSPMVQSVNLATYINAVITSRNDNNISYFGYTYKSGGGLYGHPSAAEGQADGLLLSAYIKTILNSSSIKNTTDSENDIYLFPNPVEKVLKFKDLKKTKSIEISDLNGKIIKKINVLLHDDISIDVSELTKGIYIISIISNDGSKVEKKVTKI